MFFGAFTITSVDYRVRNGFREAAKQSYFLNGSAIKRGGGGGVKGLPLRRRKIFFLNIFLLKTKGGWVHCLFNKERTFLFLQLPILFSCLKLKYFV